jgi:hypothetical protein
VQILEGQIFEGTVSALGMEGPPMRWIVVSPHGKTHAHSLTDPLELHCMPLGIMQQAIAQGRLELVDVAPDHPVLRLQRVKEQRGIVDTHLGLRAESLQQMLELLDEAVTQGADYRRYLAGEILGLCAGAEHAAAELDAVRQRVRAAVAAP